VPEPYLRYDDPAVFLGSPVSRVISDWEPESPGSLERLSVRVTVWPPPAELAVPGRAIFRGVLVPRPDGGEALTYISSITSGDTGLVVDLRLTHLPDMVAL
jgi:hypothetical protein